ncbi:MAG: hypothetical protein VX011_00710 [Candidatus Thermoplasmatota archaeon]|nr:hypothetical protein [Candidatus Thermoplasmatota archaeon]
MMPSEGFPAVDRNPFGRKPLEANDFDLLVGRDDVLDELRWYLTKGTDARMLLLTGPSGSGRTSLMRVLKGNVKRAVHVVEVDPQHPAADLMKQLHDGMIGGEPPSGPNQATDMLIQTLRREKGQALIVLDFPPHDGEHLSTILSKSMPYLERLDAMIVVIATPEHAARLGPSLMARFQDEFILEPFGDEDIATMIDVRVRRENQLGWRPHPSWIKEHLGALPRYPRELLGEMSKQYMAHQRSSQRSSVPSARAMPHEPAMDGWQDGPGATGLELDMDDLEGAREQDAPPPVRPQLDDRVEPDSRWMEDFAPVEARAESPETLEPSNVPTPVPEAAPPRVPLVSRVDPSSPFGRIARRSIDASNAQASEPMESAAFEEPESAAEETVEEAWEFTDNTVAPVPRQEQPPAPSPVRYDPLHATPSARPAFGQDVLQVLERALAEMSPTEAPSVEGLAAALTRLGMPHAGALHHRPLRVQALKELNAGQAVVVEAASQREVSPSDARMLAKLGVKRARLSQVCNGLHKDGILDVAQRGRSRVFTLSAGARAQLRAWNLLGGEA